jgi:hypothetical protein
MWADAPLGGSGRATSQNASMRPVSLVMHHLRFITQFEYRAVIAALKGAGRSTSPNPSPLFSFHWKMSVTFVTFMKN